MRRIIRPTDCALALCGLFLWAPIASGQGLNARNPRTEVTNYLFCVAAEGADQSTLFYSSDFVTTGPNIRPVQDAFLGFLRQKYSYRGNPAGEQPVQCTGVHSVEESRSTERGYINRDRQNKKTVVETGWVYGSASAETAPAAGASDASRLTGVYLGKYRCNGGDRDLKLTVRGAGNGSLTALFTFTAGSSLASYSLAGRYDGATGQFKLEPDKWEGAAPSGYNMVGMDGAYDAASNKLSGQIASGNCGPFSVVRDKTQTADAAGANPATPAAPALPAAPRVKVGRAGTASTGGAAPPAATSAGSSTTGAKSPEAPRAEESQDPRLKQMSAEDRQYMLSQGAYADAYCKNNVTLNGLYSCPCFSQKVLDARIRTNGETVQAPNALGSPVQRTPFVNLISQLDYRDCADPAKIKKYGSDRIYEVFKGDRLAKSQLDQMAACVGSSFARSFQANPVPNIVSIDRLFNAATSSCH